MRRLKAFGMKSIVGLFLVSAISAVWGWDPPLALAVTGTWSATGSMTTGRYLHTATLLLDGKVLVVGGCCSNAFGTPFSSAELYDPIAGTWSATGSMTTPRDFHSATRLPSGKVLVVGGCCSFNQGSDDPLTSAELYDPVVGT